MEPTGATPKLQHGSAPAISSGMVALVGFENILPMGLWAKLM